MERVEAFLKSMKPILRMMGLCFLFLTVTTYVSIALIYVPPLINSNIVMVDFSLKSAILGSFFGQVTMLMAINIIGRLKANEGESKN